MSLRLELQVSGTPAPAPPGALTLAAWRDDALDFWAFDRRLDALDAAGGVLQLVAPAADAPAFLGEVAIRAQRLQPRRNRASEGAWFDRVLHEHRALHDLGKPLVRADLDHAHDAWQWALRLDRDAPAAVQLAVLLHDLERLASEADARHEHLAADYQAFKHAHARAGAVMAGALLGRAGVPRALVDEVCALVAAHEHPGAAAGLRAINDADALSFFSFNSPGYAAYFGPAQTAKKVAYTLARMSDGARGQLPALRMPAGVRVELERLLHPDHRA
jgi:hypothetical protein